MIWLWVIASFQFVWIPPGQSIYHELSAQWLTANITRPNAYFGYSITYVPTSKRLIVSAPQADDIGEIYSCDIDKNTCATVPRNITRNHEKFKNNYWLGAVVKAGPSYFLTCAPLTVDRKYYKKNYIYGIFSQCYKYTNLDTVPELLNSITQNEREAHTYLFEHTMTTFGWSIDVSGKEAIIGGPAMFTGRAAIYSDLNKKPISLTGISTDVNKKIVEYNFGYSVVSGHFTKLISKKMYAVGSPYGSYGNGKILFYTSRSKTYVKYVGELPGWDETVGAMFGAVLCSAKLTPESRSDALLVGAPTYSIKHGYNLGAVFIYEPAKRLGPLDRLLKKIVGYQVGSLFGSAIVSAGDLNGDGLDEIVIGAPYEDSGSGAVYLYSSADIINQEKEEIVYLQRIIPEPDQLQRSFGLSLTALQDFDSNGCNELAIGAPETNKVKLLRCIASVQVKLFENIPVLRQFKNESFTFQSCLNVTYPDKPKPVEAQIEVQVQIIHQKAKLANPADKKYTISLDGKQKLICRPIMVNVNQTRETGSDTALKIMYEIKAKQINDPKDRKVFEVKRVSLNDRSKLESSGPIWITECSDVEHCMPDLKIEEITPPENATYEIGSKQSIEINVEVRNDGEAAYDPCLWLTFTSASVNTSPQECERISRTKLKCAPKQIISSAKTWVTQPISLDTTQLTTKDENIIVHIDMYNHCTEEKFTSVERVIKLWADPKTVVISGVTDSGPDDTVNLTRSQIPEGKNFDHIYTISNFGNTTWEGVEAKVVVQKRPFISNSTITLYTKDSLGFQKCEYVAENESEATFTCFIGKLYNNSFARVTIPMFVAPGVLETVIENKENSFYSHLSIVLIHGAISTPKRRQIISTLHIKEVTSPFWIYLIAAIMGLIILLILFFILRSCGFFERKTKEKLQNVQRSVKRQTIMRRSMMEGVRVPPGSDGESLIKTESASQAARSDRRIRP